MDTNQSQESFYCKKHPRFDTSEFERENRQIKNELLTKKSQVEQLRKELDNANIKNHEMTRVLEKTRTDLENTKFSLNLLMRKCRGLESKLQENKEALEKSHLQHEMALTDRQTLKEYAQQLSVEKYELKKKIEDLEIQHKYETVFQNDLINKQSKLTSGMQEVQDTVDKCKTEHECLMKLLKDTRISEEVIRTNEFLMDENQHLKNERVSMEETILILTAECQKFKELMKLNPEINDGNLTNKLILKHWKSNILGVYKENVAATNEIINTLNHALSKERDANKQLMLQHEEDAVEIQELMNKIEANSSAQKETHNTSCVEINVKEEIIDIKDSDD